MIEWISQVSFVPILDGNVRLIADLVYIHKYVNRPIDPMQLPKYRLVQIDPEAKVFALFDANSGYWQVKHEEESRSLQLSL